MTIQVKFSSASNVNGLEALAFEQSGIFFKFRERVTVANDRATFRAISAPGDFAFRVDSPAGTRWRSGPLVQNSSFTDTFLILDAGILNFSQADLNNSRPTLPIQRGPTTITSLNIAVGAGDITAAGMGEFFTPHGQIPLNYTYVFRLNPGQEAANWSWSKGIPPVVELRTISMTVTGSQGGVLGFLVNALVTVVVWVFQGSILAEMERTIQHTIDAQVASALATRNAPPGTIPTVETLTMDPVNGITIRAFAGVSLEKACASTPSSGSITIRPTEQLAHLRAIRDGLLTRSPQGLIYIELFKKFNRELARILLNDEELLRLIDTIVIRLLETFPMENPGIGRLSKDVADDIMSAATIIERVASEELKLTIASMREEVLTFVDRPAQDVLDESFMLLGDNPLPDEGTVSYTSAE